jgi:hypothetical protein
MSREKLVKYNVILGRKLAERRRNIGQKNPGERPPGFFVFI